MKIVPAVADFSTFGQSLLGGPVSPVPDEDADSLSRADSLETSATGWELRIAAARQGDRDALGRIFERLRAYLRVRAEAQLDRQLQVKVSPSDVVQETLLEAHRGIARFEGTTRAELVVWVQGILNHRVQTAYRRYRGTGKRDLGREISVDHHDDSPRHHFFVGSSGSSPSGKAIVNEEQRRLEQALKELSPSHEQVIRLRNELKLSFDEVAIALSCTPDAAQKRWSRAVKQLANKLKTDAPDK